MEVFVMFKTCLKRVYITACFKHANPALDRKTKEKSKSRLPYKVFLDYFIKLGYHISSNKSHGITLSNPQWGFSPNNSEVLAFPSKRTELDVE